MTGWTPKFAGYDLGENPGNTFRVTDGAETIAVACPFCNIMMEDGLKGMNKEEDVRVRDIAELVAENLPQGSENTPQ